MVLTVVFIYYIIAGIIGVIVYRDAKKFSMNQWLWVLAVIYVPKGVGIIIYLIMRASEKKKKRCANCAEPIDPSFALPSSWA